MNPLILKRFYGGPVSGESYWPRPEISGPMVSTLLAGESIGLFGLRRTGKSSLLFEIQRALKADKKTPVYVDVQGNDRVDPIISALLKVLPDSGSAGKLTTALTGTKVTTFIDLINRFRGKERAAAMSPREMLHHIELMKGDFGKLLSSQSGSIILMIDELPYLIIHMLDSGLNASEVNGFMATLRTWRQDFHLPMILSGSVGLQQLVRHRGIARENFNDLVLEPTPPPLSDDDARQMLRALADGAHCDWMDSTIIDTVLAEIAVNYPSFIQFAFGRVADRNARTPDAVRKVFIEQIRPSLDKDFYNQFDTRIARYDEQIRLAARAIFRRLDKNAQAPLTFDVIDGLIVSSGPVDRDEVLNSLVEDGFIAVDTKALAISFGSRLVESWWQSKPYRR